MPQLDVLPRPNILQIHHKLNQTLHPMPLPAHFLTDLVPKDMLVPRDPHLHLRRMFHHRDSLPMHAHPALLGQEATWYMHQRHRVLVRKRRLQYRHRCHHPWLCAACYLEIEIAEEAEMGPNCCVGLGGFVFATSILRMTTLDVASKAPDPTYGTLKSTMWTTIEASTAITCACLPMMRTPIQRLMPKLFPTFGTGYRSGKNGGADVHHVNIVPAKPVFTTAKEEDTVDVRPTTTESNSATLTANGGQDLEMGSSLTWSKRLSSARSHGRILSLSSENSSSMKYDA